ncbi:MAG: ATP-binding protein [Vulcanimicrobiaceae bacterium]
MERGRFAARVLGGFEVCDASGRSLNDRALRRAAPVLKYLFARPEHAAPRSAMAADLWPNSTPSAAATNLRVGLHWLNAALGAGSAVETRGESVRLLPECWQIDADDFERDASTAERAESPDSAHALAVLERYGGAFLLHDSHSEWIAPRRARLETLYRNLLLRCARNLKREHSVHTSGVEAHLRRYLEGNFDDCEIVDALCTTLRANGDLSEALRAESAHRSAGSCSCALSAQQHTDLPKVADPPVLWLRTDTPGFVGRSAEIARLGDVLDDALRESGHTVLLVGAQGIGKTRLAGETMAEAQDRGALVLAATCEHARGAVLRPFVQMLEAAVEILPDGLLATVLRSRGPALARISRILRKRLGTSTYRAGESGSEISRIIPAICEAFAQLSKLWPLVILVEDIHAADSASVAAFSALAVAAPSARLLLLGTAREAEFSTCLAADVLEGVRSGISLLRIPPLGPSDSLALARSFWDSPAEPRAVVRRARGNPLAIVEYSRGAQGRHIQTAVITRLERLPAAEHAVVRALALADPIALSEVSLARVVGRPDIAAAIERLCAAGLVQRQPGGYAFSQTLFADAAERLIDAPERAAIHAGLAALPEVQRHAEATALHFLEAGTAFDTQALEWTVRALEEAMAVRSIGSAIDLLRRASERPASSLGRNFNLALGLGIAETFDGNAERARTALERALGLASDDAERTDAYIALIELAETEMRVQDGLALCDLAAACVADSTPKDLLLRARRAYLLLLAGRFDDAVAGAADLLARDDELTKVRACIVIAIANAYRGRSALAVEYFHRAYEGAQRIGADSEAALVTVNLAATHFHCGKLSLANREYRRAADFALSHGRHSIASICIRNAGECELYLGNLAEALSCFDVSERRAERSGRPMLVAEARMLRGVALRDQGEFDPAFEMLEAAYKTFNAHANIKLQGEACAHAMLCCWRTRDRSRAKRWIAAAKPEAGEYADIDTRAFVYVAAALAEILVGKKAVARADLARAVSDLGDIGAAMRKLEVSVYASEAAAELGDTASLDAAAALQRTLKGEIDHNALATLHV